MKTTDAKEPGTEDAIASDGHLLTAVRKLIDRQEILDCLIRFSRGMDRFDRELVLSAFHPDATDDHGEVVGSPEDLYEFAFGVHDDGQLNTHHNLLNHTCEIDGDVAHTETYYLFTGRNRDGKTVWMAQGRYLDRLEKRKGEWKIAMRYCVVEWSSLLAAGSVPFEDIPDVHANGVPSRGRGDPSYRRPLNNVRPRRIPGDLKKLSKKLSLSET